MLRIHEFSTGIKPQEDPQYGWISLGFTGKYMNQTLSPIPSNVERAIANKLFAVTEGAEIDKPALIGRVVPETSDTPMAWAVIAVITRGRDDGGRPLSAYRYFLCEGAENLLTILRWMIDYSNQHQDQPPAFNPLERRPIGGATQVDPQQLPALPVDQAKSMIQAGQLPSDGVLSSKYSCSDIHVLANHLAKNSDNPAVAWAYNVETLTKPHSFTLICAANQQAYDRIKRLRASQPSPVITAGIDEQRLKSAIKTLMSSSAIKQDAVNIIASEINNPNLQEKEWRSLLDSQGANNAIRKKIYSPQMAYLLALMVMIPEALPEYLGWLNLKPGKSPDNEHQKLSIKRIDELYELFPKTKKTYLDHKLIDGAKVAIVDFLKHRRDAKPDLLMQLLGAESPLLWRRYFNYILSEIKTDVSNISKHFLSSAPKRKPIQTLYPSQSHSVTEPVQGKSKPSFQYNFDESIWKELIDVWQRYASSRHRSTSYYKNFAKILFDLGKTYGNSSLDIKKNAYRLSAYFHQISDEKVAPEVFDKAFSKTSDSEVQVTGSQGNLRTAVNYLNLPIKRKETIPWCIIAAAILITLAALGWGFKWTYDQGQNNFQNTIAAKAANQKDGLETTRKSLLEVRERVNKYASTSRKPEKIKLEAIEKIIIQVICAGKKEDLEFKTLENYQQELKSQRKEIQKLEQQMANIIYRYEIQDEQFQFMNNRAGIVTPGEIDYLTQQVIIQLRKEELDRFPDTRKVIKTTVEELEKSAIDQNKELKSDEIKDKIAQALKDIFYNNSLQYGVAIKDEAGHDEFKKNKEIIRWIDTIYLYKRSKESKNPGGFISIEDKAIPALIKTDIRAKLPDLFKETSAPQPTGSAEPNAVDDQTWLKTAKTAPNLKSTRQALNGIVGRLSQELADQQPRSGRQAEKPRKRVISELQNTLGVLSYKDVIENPKQEIDPENWLQGIYDYQEEVGLTPDGVISPGGDTAQKLEQDLKTALRLQ